MLEHRHFSRSGGCLAIEHHRPIGRSLGERCAHESDLVRSGLALGDARFLVSGFGRHGKKFHGPRGRLFCRPRLFGTRRVCPFVNGSRTRAAHSEHAADRSGPVARSAFEREDHAAGFVKEHGREVRPRQTLLHEAPEFTQTQRGRNNADGPGRTGFSPVRLLRVPGRRNRRRNIDGQSFERSLGEKDGRNRRRPRRAFERPGVPAVGVIHVEVRSALVVVKRPENTALKRRVVNVEVFDHRLRKRDAPQRLPERTDERGRRLLGERNRSGISRNQNGARCVFNGLRDNGSRFAREPHLPRVLSGNAFAHVAKLPQRKGCRWQKRRGEHAAQKYVPKLHSGLAFPFYCRHRSAANPL